MLDKKYQMDNCDYCGKEIEVLGEEAVYLEGQEKSLACSGCYEKKDLEENYLPNQEQLVKGNTEENTAVFNLAFDFRVMNITNTLNTLKCSSDKDEVLEYLSFINCFIKDFWRESEKKLFFYEVFRMINNQHVEVKKEEGEDDEVLETQIILEEDNPIEDGKQFIEYYNYYLKVNENAFESLGFLQYSEYFKMLIAYLAHFLQNLTVEQREELEKTYGSWELIKIEDQLVEITYEFYGI